MLKALALAFDPAAPDGEQKAAFLGILRIAKAKNMTAQGFLEALAPRGAFDDNDPPPMPVSSGIKMPFGKHKGRTLSWIAWNDPNYLAWLRDEADLRQPLRSAVDDLANWMDLG